MRVLFVHNNFPGQYRRIATYLPQFREYKLAAATLTTNEQPDDFVVARYKPHREPQKGIHPSLVTTEKAVITGQAAYSSLLELKKKGFRPDIIMSHSGWGASMFMKDVFPDAKLLSYFEWYYHCHGSDGEFLMREKKQSYGPNDELRLRMKNTPILHDLAAMDWGQSPTKFQHSKFPSIFQDRISVLHDGVDIDYYAPNEKAKLDLGNGKVLTRDDEVITYVARGMEEYRGFPQFMEAVSELQKVRPNLHVVILGKDRVAYGAPRSDGKSFKEWALETFEFDHDRLHIMGLQPINFFKTMMQVTSAHVYLTVPFVLSWSLMEAMSAGALIVGSDTEPVKEMIEDGKNGLLVPFFKPAAIVKKVNHILDNRNDYQPLREAARQTMVESYATRDLLPKYKQLIESVVNGSQVAG